MKKITITIMFALVANFTFAQISASAPSAENTNHKEVEASSSYLQGGGTLICPPNEQGLKNKKIQDLIQKIKTDENYAVEEVKKRKNYCVSVQSYSIELGEGTFTEFTEIGYYGEKKGSFAFVYEGEKGCYVYTTYKGEYTRLANIGKIFFNMSNSLDRTIQCSKDILEERDPYKISKIEKVPVTCIKVGKDEVIFSVTKS